MNRLQSKLARLTLKKTSGGGVKKRKVQSLEQAAERGNVAFIKRLVNRGANVNAFGLDGKTLLQRYASRGHTRAVQTLLKAGAKVNMAAKNRDGANAETALHLASKNGHTSTVSALLAHGAHANKEA